MRIFPCCLVFLAVFAAPARAQLVFSDGFESGSLASWTAGGAISTGFGNINPKEGSQYVALSFPSGGDAQTLTFSRSFSLGANAPVTVEFFAQRTDFTGINDVSAAFEVKIDSTVLTTSFPTFAGSNVQAGGWTTYQLVTPSDLGAGLHTLTFTFIRTASGFMRGPQLVLDGIAVSVPEPSIAGLLVLGGSAAYLVRRLRQRSRPVGQLRG
ncbi:MAG: PEP-CTERM sorting domain-containing protein [Verrucomicrobia bacterium]|jgi:hypothetical protein|nr:PEP-CTERM sorting domain-containing protein [Verrucomicrobiota bacterium]